MKERNEFYVLEKKAELAFREHRMICEQIEKELIKSYPEEENKINDVIYQPGDGIVIVYDDDKNIPLMRFLNGYRV